MERNNKKRVVIRKEPKEPEKKFSLQRLLASEAVIFALVSTTSYLGVYLYQSSYLSYFGIPTRFITLDSTQLLSFFAAIFTLLFLIFQILFAIYITITPNAFFQKISWKSTLTLLIPIIAIGLFLYFYREYAVFWITLLVIYLLSLVVIEIILRKTSGSENRIRSFTDIIFLHPSIKENPSFNTAANTVLILSFVTLAIFILSLSGRASAEKQTGFYTLNKTPECVVLYLMGNEKAVCSPFDRSTRQIERIYQIVNLSENPDYRLKEEILGPLTLKNLVSPAPKP
jgi:hypothetical protein